MRKISCLIMLVLISGLVWAQRAVSGKVTDSNGSPVAGASVVVQGTTVGTVTGEDGSFTLTVPANRRVLVITAVGLAPLGVNITSESHYNVSMKTGAEAAMQEVVVVGYGTQRRREVTGSVSRVSGGAVAQRPNQSFEQALAGRAAGVQITVPNGVLNNPPVFRIRGTNSISLSSYPLIVVDGVLAPTGDFSSTNAAGNPLASINPNDIESIDIAKDAASTAIYGSRAANGVVFITTKRGRSGAPRVGVDIWTGWTNTYRMPQVMNAAQYTDFKNMAASNNPTVNTTNPSGSGYTKFNIATDANGNPVDTRWQDVIYRQGFQYNATFNVSGGSENTNYYFAAGYTNQEGIIRKNNFKRSNALFNIDSRISKLFSVGGKLSYSNEKNEAAISSGSLPGEGFSTAGAGRLALVNAPNTPVYRNDGSYNIASNNVVGSGANTIAQVGFYNPQVILDRNRSNNENHHIQSNVYAQLKPLSWITLKSQYGIDYLLADNDIFWNPIHGDGFAATGQVFANQGTYKRWMLTNTAQFERTVADNHNFNLLVGQEQDRRTSRGYGINRQTLSDPIYNVVQAGFNVNNPSGNVFGENYLVSGFGRLNYNFNNKYFLSGNIRQDEYSALGVKKGTFWGASAGWDVAKESFWQSIGNTVNGFRLKGSYGKVGNISGIGDYTIFSSFSSGLYGGNPTQAFSAAGNPELRWETSKKLDVGLVFGLFRDRITGEITYYKNDIDDLILNVPQAPSAGLPSSIPLNVGSMYNKGIEFSITGTPVQKRNFSWTSSFNITKNDNKVTSLAPGLPFILTATSGLESVSRTEVGHPLGTLWVVRTQGVDPATGRRVFLNNAGQPVYYQHVAPSGQFQWMTATNTSHRAITQSADAVMYANVLPKYYGGFDNTFRVGGFDLNVLTTFQTGFSVYYGTNAGLHDQRFWNNHVDMLTDAWQKTGDAGKKYAKPVYLDNVSNGSAIPLDINVFKGDFIKIRDVRLGYTLPRSIVDKVKINSLRMYVAGQNLGVFTKYPGPDPEVSSNGNGTTNQGIDRNTVTNARTITVGLNVGF